MDSLIGLTRFMEVFKTVLMDLLGVLVVVDFEGVKMGSLLSRKVVKNQSVSFILSFILFVNIVFKLL